jgi:hypothetical protein
MARTFVAVALLITTMAIPVAAQTLTVSVSGAGKVTGTGIDCPSDCSESLTTSPTRISVAPSRAPRTLVLTATADAGSSFKEWGGSCAEATGPTCTVTIASGAAITISAVFTSLTAAAAAAGAVAAPVLVFPDLIPETLLDSRLDDGQDVNHAHSEPCTTHTHALRQNLVVQNLTDGEVSSPSIRVRLVSSEGGLIVEWSVPSPPPRSHTIAGAFLRPIQHCPSATRGWGPAVRFEIDISNLVPEADENNNAKAFTPVAGAPFEPGS